MKFAGCDNQSVAGFLHAKAIFGQSCMKLFPARRLLHIVQDITLDPADKGFHIPGYFHAFCRRFPRFTPEDVVVGNKGIALLQYL